jgi:hypothetical protein
MSEYSGSDKNAVLLTSMGHLSVPDMVGRWGGEGYGTLTCGEDRTLSRLPEPGQEGSGC